MTTMSSSAVPCLPSVEKACPAIGLHLQGSEQQPICLLCVQDEEAPAEVPNSVHLVDGAVSVLARVPKAAFSLADLLTAACRHEGGKERELVLSRLIGHLRGDVTAAGSQASDSGDQLLAPAHLLAVLAAEDAANWEALYKNGMCKLPDYCNQTTHHLAC